MDIIRRILGEDEADKPEIEAEEEVLDTPGETLPEPEPAAAEDSAIEELANMWTAGNRDDVARRFMQMDNETAVRVCFSIGREGALDLGRMVDDILKRMGDHEGITPPPKPGEEGEEFSEEGEETTEPISIEPPDEASEYPVKGITGKTGLGHKSDNRV
jgi:hypothetical protein